MQLLRNMLLRLAGWLSNLLFGRIPVYNENDYEEILFPEDPANEADEEEVLESKAETKCEHRIGTITKLEPHGMIDGRYYFNTADLLQKNIAVGQSVRYIAYRSDENKEWTIKQIRVVEIEQWQEGVQETPASEVTGKYTAYKKTLVAEVKNRRGRFVTMEPNDITCNLDCVQSEFLPVEGDCIKLTAIVELRDAVNGDERVVDIEFLKPLRSRTYEGKVSHVSDDGTAGIVAHQIYFTNNVCDGGFMPGKNDRVVVRAIESKQGSLIWRAIHLIIMESSSEHNSLLARIHEERLFDSKHGVVVVADCDNKSLKIGEQTVFKVRIENAGTEAQTLTSIVLKNSEISNVMRLTTEIFGDLTIEVGSFEELEVVATARSSGHYSEVTIFRFEGDWEIGCLLDIYVHIEDKYGKHLTTSECSSVTTCNNENSNNVTNGRSDHQRSNNRYQIQRQMRQQLAKTMPTKMGFVVPGVRPVKPAAFIPKSLIDFPIPENLKSILLGDGTTYKNQATITTELEEAFPYLTEELKDSNYLLKFHALIHMEDIEHLCAIQKYNCDRVCFTRQGEYLVLEIPNLAECKPSLVVGDKLYAIELITKENPDAVRYEGYIHKVTSHSIKLKFGEAFHNQYDGKSMSVSFSHSRTGIRRAHQALNEVHKHLGKTWLFPNTVGIIKQNQMNIVGEYPLKNISDVEHVCESDKPAERPAAKSVRKSESKKSRTPLVNGKKKRISLATMLDDTESEGSDVEKEREEPTTDDHELPAHSYANIERPGYADRAIEWEEENRRQRNTPSYAQPNIPSKPVERTNNKCRDVIVKWVNPTLNKYQKSAVRNILKGEARPLPYIIHGPPGTGKTITIVETILQIMFMIPESRILVATPSNSSADLLCERLLSWKLLKPGDLVRLVGYNYMCENRMSPILKPYCTCMDTKSMDKNAPQISYDDDAVKYSSREVIGRHRITVGTCVSIGVLYSMGFPKNHFTHIIVDEAGQSMEPEIMIPLAFLDSQGDGQAILAGDPRQLGPVVMSRLAAKMGLSDSLLSRLYTRFPYHCDPQGYPETHGYDPRLVTRLLYNYRSLPNILELYSSLFYNSELIPKVCPDCSPERKMFDKIEHSLQDNLSSQEVGQIIFHGVKGVDRQDDDSPSWYNDHEVAKVVGLLAALYSEGLKSDDIGIVTPYQKQVWKIREMIQMLELEMPKVGTVEEFQGQERNVIIISTVRSNHHHVDNDVRHSLGFVSSQQRVNVAISRARALLIIVGNPFLLERDSTWSKLIKLCTKRGYYSGCDLPVRLLD